MSETTFDLTNLPHKPNGRLDLPDAPTSGEQELSQLEGQLAPSKHSLLDDLRADLAADLAEHFELDVPGRPGWRVRFSNDVSADELDNWQNQAKSKRHQGGLDGGKFARLIVSNKAIALLRGGEVLRDAYDEEFTFRHREFWALVGATSAADAVKAVYQLDGSIDAASRAVLSAAGWGDDLTPGPTQPREG